MTRVVLAPDKFKGSLTAAEVVRHLSVGLLAVRPALDLTTVPIADGGDGTVDAAVAAGFERRPVTVSGPTGRPVATTFALLGDRAVVELADACGLVRLPGGVPAPMTASSFGFGQVVEAAVIAGATTVMLGVGGSASTDGGAGMLAALGARVLNRKGQPVGLGGGGLREVADVDLAGLSPALRNVQLLLANDVDNPLLGPSGAAAVYGPQKGATADDVVTLEHALCRWAAVVARVRPEAVDGPWTDAPGAGAAGGVGFAAVTILGALPHPGIELILGLTGFAAKVEGADLVITGEGSLDAQTLQGKGPAGVAAAATALGIPVVAVAGRVLLDPGRLRSAGFRQAYALLDIEPDPALCMSDAGRLLERTGCRIARDCLT